MDYFGGDQGTGYLGNESLEIQDELMMRKKTRHSVNKIWYSYIGIIVVNVVSVLLAFALSISYQSKAMALLPDEYIVTSEAKESINLLMSSAQEQTVTLGCVMSFFTTAVLLLMISGFGDIAGENQYFKKAYGAVLINGLLMTLSVFFVRAAFTYTFIDSIIGSVNAVLSCFVFFFVAQGCEKIVFELGLTFADNPAKKLFQYQVGIAGCEVATTILSIALPRIPIISLITIILQIAIIVLYILFLVNIRRLIKGVIHYEIGLNIKNSKIRDLGVAVVAYGILISGVYYLLF